MNNRERHHDVRLQGYNKRKEMLSELDFMNTAIKNLKIKADWLGEKNNALDLDTVDSLFKLISYYHKLVGQIKKELRDSNPRGQETRQQSLKRVEDEREEKMKRREAQRLASQKKNLKLVSKYGDKK